MEINSHKLRFRGTVELPQPVEQGHSYHISIVGEVNKVSLDNNHDGTADETSTMDISSLELLDDNGAIIKAKDRRKKSVQLRMAILGEHLKENMETEPQDYYDKRMNQLIRHYDRISPYLDKLDEEQA